MCKNAQTAANLIAAIEPTLANLLNATGLATTTEGQATIAAFDAAVKAVAAWKSGTPAQEAIEALEDFESVFNTLPIPADAKLLSNIIIAGIVTVVGVLQANSPAPVAATLTEESASDEETAAMHQAHVIADTTDKVRTLVPEFKRSIFTSPAHQYNNAWNHAVSQSDPKYTGLKV